MSIYKGYGGYGSPAQDARVMDELMESYENAKERIGELGAEIIELKDKLDRVKKRNKYLEDMHKADNDKFEKFKNTIEDFNKFGSELLIDLKVSFYESEAMNEFEKCFNESERTDIEIEAKYQQAELLKDEEDE